MALTQVSRDLGRGPARCTGGRQVKAGGCAARRQWRRVEQPARKTERHLEVRRHDVSLLLGLGGYTYNSLKPRGLFHTSGCSPRSRGGMLSFLSASPLPFRCLPPRGPRSPADKKGLCNKMARRHRHTQQGKEPRCPRPPPPLLHRGGSQSPDRSPRPQGRGVSLRAGSRQGEPRPPRAHTWLGWG